VLDRIQKFKSEIDFDFRSFANPQDPLNYLFEEWVDYYRTKYAICMALAPESIVEIGVRHGYSALTFLRAAPQATYLGIDADVDSIQRRDELEWAEQRLAGHAAQILRADSRNLVTLPGDYFDLMHVDAQRDGDSLFHDLELGLEKAHWLLVDGYFRSRENLLSATLFLEKYRNLIAGAYVIPGYVGDLLIETRTLANRRVFRNKARHHQALRETYDNDYFLGDCGGYTSFKAEAGRRLTDTRLLTLLDLCSPTPGMRILDVGCGRGELAYACFAAGANVTGLDYSQSAVAIATTTFADCIGDRLNFVHADALEYQPANKFDAILAADVVEHLSLEILDAAFARFAGWLAPGGKLIIHTWPNRIAYEYNYRLRRDKARAVGAYLPRNPRTYYEDLMHINEQTPAKLRRSLRRHFPEVAIRLDGGSAPGLGSAWRNLRDHVRTAESIYALASPAPIARGDIQNLLEQGVLEAATIKGIHVESVDCPLRMPAGGHVDCSAFVVNRTVHSIASFAPFPVNLSYHWYRDGALAVYDGVRSALVPRLRGGERRCYRLIVETPTVPGRYDLGVTLVQEGRFWFDDLSKQTMLVKTIDVV
jgi:2-polyprenyl-3-methyl-5-hydroxy-6-metoxy-1,4-benzoquinol methylase